MQTAADIEVGEHLTLAGSGFLAIVTIVGLAEIAAVSWLGGSLIQNMFGA